MCCLTSLLNQRTFRITTSALKLAYRSVSKPQCYFFHTSLSVLRKKYSRPPFLPNSVNHLDPLVIDDEKEHDDFDEPDENDFGEIIDREFWINQCVHQVLVLQPYIKWGPRKLRITTPELKLEEAVALVESLEGWKVLDSFTLPVADFRRNDLFGKGTIEKLKNYLSENPEVSAILLSKNNLSWAQQFNIEKELKVPIFDRYSLVMQIFRQHAKSKAAKLQVQLAEIPYIWARLRYIPYGSLNHFGGVAKSVGTSGRSFLETQKDILRRKEVRIKKKLAEIRDQRKGIRVERSKNELPVVAVVGYTNAGKTSLIKALTGSERLEPKNVLFATLDVTAHLGVLPSKLNCFYVDTVGFISDIPTTLIDAFQATLEDALEADVIVHIRDISHPDTKAQNLKVEEILFNLPISKETRGNIITVGNKIDLVDKEELQSFSEKNENIIYVSTKNGTGIHELLEKIEELIMRTTNRFYIIIRVISGGDEYQWLYKEATISQEKPDEADNQYVFLHVITTSSVLGRFKSTFLKRTKKQR